MKTKSFVTIAIAVLAIAVAFVVNRKIPTPIAADAGDRPVAYDAKAVPVLVELFTSEGCSSCPPADELLARLAQTQPVAGVEIIPLSEHVDYWNRLGWTDPYSSAQFTSRQNEYAAAFETDEVYTPQMIVDGRMQFVGSNSSRALDAVARAAKTEKAVVVVGVQPAGIGPKVDSVSITVRVTGLIQLPKGDPSDVVIAIAESGLRSSVSRGENAGRKLNHIAVVRKLMSLGSIDYKLNAFTGEVVAKLKKEWNQDNLRVVAFVQERASRRIMGASSIALR